MAAPSRSASPAAPRGLVSDRPLQESKATSVSRCHHARDKADVDPPRDRERNVAITHTFLSLAGGLMEEAGC